MLSLYCDWCGHHITDAPAQTVYFCNLTLLQGPYGPASHFDRLTCLIKWSLSQGPKFCGEDVVVKELGTTEYLKLGKVVIVASGSIPEAPVAWSGDVMLRG